MTMPEGRLEETGISLLGQLLEAAEAHDCVIIHVSKLAGCEPVVPNQPCLGDATGTLVDLADGEYLRLLAEIASRFVVERTRALPAPVVAAAGADAALLAERPRATAYLTSGYLAIGPGRYAVCQVLDSAGQEATIIYRRLRSAHEIQTYWSERQRLCGHFVVTYRPAVADVDALCRELDRHTPLGSFDIAAFAAERGLRPADVVADAAEISPTREQQAPRSP